MGQEHLALRATNLARMAIKRLAAQGKREAWFAWSRAGFDQQTK